MGEEIIISCRPFIKMTKVNLRLQKQQDLKINLGTSVVSQSTRMKQGYTFFCWWLQQWP